MFNFCYKKKNIKKLGHTLKKITGRNNTGKIVLRHRGGGVKKRYRVIDFKHVFLNMPMLFLRKEYDPYRTSFIFLAFYLNGFFSYKPLMEGFIDLNKEPIFFVASYYAEIKKGNSLPIEFIPIGSIISNLELRPGGGSSLIRSAGSYGQIIAKGFFNQQYVLIQLCSGEEYLINKQCFATLGRVSNQSFHTKKIKKAGTARKMNRKPSVRGVAMNPVDHPHGGGEGKTSGGRPSISFSGVLAKGFRTRKKRKTNIYIFKSRRISYNKK